MATVNEQAVDAVTINNVKTLGESVAFHTHMSMGNAVSGQNAMQQVTLAAVGNIVKRLTEADMPEALALSVLGQQGTKVAQTTPPPTA